MSVPTPGLGEQGSLHVMNTTSHAHGHFTGSQFWGECDLFIHRLALATPLLSPANTGKQPTAYWHPGHSQRPGARTSQSQASSHERGEGERSDFHRQFWAGCVSSPLSLNTAYILDFGGNLDLRWFLKDANQ